jgi:hypothetical protein
MRDPHVESLLYKLQMAQNVTYDNPSPLEIDYEEFSGCLENGVLTCQMKVHYPSIEAARRVVDPYLRTWEIYTSLNLGRGEMRFVYEDGKMIDRNPPPLGSPQVIQVEGIGSATAFGNATIHVTRKQYPKPPKTFRTTPDFQTLWQRYEMYLDGKEPLLSMAYFCLTVIEAKAGGRPRAPAIFAIEEEVLRKLGELTSVRGDSLTARKAPRNTTIIPLADKERAWIEAVIKQLIRRVGESASGHTPFKLKMTDLPSLTP